MERKRSIKIGVDIRDLKFSKTGQKTVLEEYYKQFLLNNDPTFQFFFLDADLPLFSRKLKIGIILNHLMYQYWKQILLPLKAYLKKVDIVFGCDYFAPIITLGFKNVQVYHDAFFYEYPEHYNPLWRRLFQSLAIPAAKKSVYIISISEYARLKIHQYMGLPLEKLVNIYPGPKTFSNGTVTINDQEFLPPSEPYILHVGVWEKRKNIPQLLKAFSQLINSSPERYKLVLVGSGNNKVDSDDTEAVLGTIQELGLTQHVICTGYLSDYSLTKAYRHASLYVFPSFNEGFGIPILEAFRFNIPVLVANNSCLPEVGGDAVISFDPYSSDEMAQKIQSILADPSLQNSLKEKGKKRLEFFSWEKASSQMKEIFKRAALDA